MWQRSQLPASLYCGHLDVHNTKVNSNQPILLFLSTVFNPTMTDSKECDGMPLTFLCVVQCRIDSLDNGQLSATTEINCSNATQQMFNYPTLPYCVYKK